MDSTQTPDVIINDDASSDLSVESNEFANAETRECSSTTVTELPPVVQIIRAYASMIDSSREIAKKMSPGDAAVIMSFAAQADAIASLFMNGIERLQREVESKESEGKESGDSVSD